MGSDSHIRTNLFINPFFVSPLFKTPSRIRWLISEQRRRHGAEHIYTDKMFRLITVSRRLLQLKNSHSVSSSDVHSLDVKALCGI